LTSRCGDGGGAGGVVGVGAAVGRVIFVIV
jgi:hypothetical protein